MSEKVTKVHIRDSSGATLFLRDFADDQARTDAAAAASDAASALEAATAAAETAHTAETTASNAFTQATLAAQKADDAKETAEGYSAQITAAQTAAEAAQTAAATANSNAAAAQTTANSASTAAQNAANAASAAQTTADSASTAASAAQTTADGAAAQASTNASNITALTSRVAALEKLQILSGTAEVQVVTANTAATVDITFDTPFSSVPAISCCLATGAGSVGQDLHCACPNVTATGATFSGRRGQAGSVWVRWMAVGFRS